MKKFRRWLIDHFLPVYLKEELLKENDRLRDKIREQDVHFKQLNAYIDGLEYGLRSQRRIVINNGEVKK